MSAFNYAPQHLSFTQKLYFASGHFFNDLCASMWFSYLLVYLQYVLLLDSSMAGILLLIGQIADGISTLFIGIESNTTFKNSKYGKRKIWHLVGTLCVACTFGYLFSPCIGCNSSTPNWIKFVYYCPIIVIFQFGWACVQISHLTLIPFLASDPHDRVDLTAFRYAFTVSAYIMSYAVSWFYLHRDSVTLPDSASKVTPENAGDFESIAITILVVGFIFSSIFHVNVGEPSDREVAIAHAHGSSAYFTPKPNPETDETDTHRPIYPYSDWRHWILNRNFYLLLLLNIFIRRWQNSLVYMLTRMASNVSMVYIPLYLMETQHLNKTCIAIIPLVIYVSGFITAFGMKRLNIVLGRKIVFGIGTFLIIGSSLWMYFPNLNNQIYGVSVLLGSGTSTIIIVALSLTADLIGRHTDTGAFVYGFMSLVDKLSCGIAVMAFQKFYPSPDVSKCDYYFRDIMVCFPSITAALALVLVLMMPKMYRDRVAERPLLSTSAQS